MIIVDTVKEVTDIEKCCRENGVPDVCLGRCKEESKITETREETEKCEKWLKDTRFGYDITLDCRGFVI